MERHWLKEVPEKREKCMAKVFIFVLLMLAAAFVWHKAWQKGLAQGEEAVGGRPRLWLTLLAMLGGGGYFALQTVRGLARGEVVCISKGGGCASPTYTLAVSPENYWFNLSFLGITGAMLLWASWLIVRHQLAERD